MNLPECLVRAPSPHVLRLARSLGVESPQVTADVVNSVSARLKDERYLAGVTSGLSDEELTALRMVAFCGGGSGIVVEKCHQKLNELTRKWRRNGAKVVEAVIKAGIVYTGRENYRQIYFIPADLRERVAGVLLPPILQRALAAEAPVVAADPEPLAPVRHVHLLLSYVKKNQVKVAQGGAMYRRAQRDIISSLGLPDELPDETESFQAVHPLHLSFILNYCKRQGLLTENEQREIEFSPKVEEWVSKPTASKAWDILSFLLDEWVRPDPDVQTMLEIMRHVPVEAWVRFEPLVAEMEHISLEHSWHALETRLDKAIRMLAYGGMIVSSSTPSGDVLRLAALGRALLASRLPLSPDGAPLAVGDDLIAGRVENSFFLQGTFELLVPASVDPSILWTLEHVADLVKPDQMLIYRISRESIYRALSGGMNASAILGFLRRHSKNEIPQNVAYSIEEWSKGYGRVEFVEALILHCDTEELCSEIKASKRMQQYIIGEVGPRHLVINRQYYREAVEALQSEGYMPKPGIRR
ncbi:MAG: hypothetical protein HPY55_02190 [Firmicutes bacterium]|nr:hypothetical protein [Bacillota bacterium]